MWRIACGPTVRHGLSLLGRKRKSQMKNGWVVAVKTVNSQGVGTVRHYVVAIEDEDDALKAVQAVLSPGDTATGATPVEARLLELRNMQDGEVRLLGKG